MRTRQASARLIGTPAYLPMSINTGSICSPRSKPTTTARRVRSAASGAPPRAPRRWNASDKTASQVRQGGGCPDERVAAQPWCASRRLSRATRKPASTRTLPAIAGRLEIRFLPPAQVDRQAAHRPDEIGDGVERRGAPAPRGDAQTFPHDVGFREVAPARLGLDFGDERLGQPHRECFHRNELYYITGNNARQTRSGPHGGRLERHPARAPHQEQLEID